MGRPSVNSLTVQQFDDSTVYCVSSVPDLYIPEQVWIVRYPKLPAAFCGYITQYDFLCPYMGIFFLIGVVRHVGIKIGKDGRTLIIFRMVGVIDAQVFDDNALRHIGRVSKIMLAGIESSN